MKTTATKKNIFLTGATGNMGWAGLMELLKRTDHFNITILARPSKVNQKKLAPYSHTEGLNIIWGDLMNYSDVLKGVSGADFVLHVGGMVSPAADMFPAKTMKVNVTAAQYIVKAVKAQPNANEIGVVYIGSVAQTGQHTVPYHWGRCGDPIYTSILDYYSVSKCLAEFIISESGLKKWVSIRQSGMLYPKLLMKADDPIAYHVPFASVLEWSTIEDSGRVLANVCEEDVPQEFWRGFYNLSSGPSFRLTNYDFEQLLLKTISCPPVEKVFDINWFATQNFHGQWYLDADVLEHFLHFRANIDCKEYFRMLKKQLPWYFSLAPIAPAPLIRLFMKHVTSSKPLGTLYWFKHHNMERIKAHFGSIEEWKKIPSWRDFDRSHPSDVPIIHSHGYDETKPTSQLDIDDMRVAAEFRGGKCLSQNMEKGDLYSPLEWECQFGHRFTATPNTILRGGHWCPECLPKYVEGENPWHFEEIAKGNPFFAQVWNRK